MTDELKAKMLAAATAVAKTRAELAQLNGEMAKLGKEGNAAALANIWGNLKNSALEEGAAKLGPLGAGLEALGPAGLAAAAGVAAVVGAFEGIEKTAEWAEQLERASNTLGLTTTKLQEFDFIAASIGIPVDRMRESMAGLARTVGLVQSGFARSMQTKAFTDALHISPEDLRSWGDLEHQLPHIIEAFSRLDPETRAGLAQRLKMDPEVLTALVGAKDRLGDLIDEAHRYGIVMDEETVKQERRGGRETACPERGHPGRGARGLRRTSRPSVIRRRWGPGPLRRRNRGCRPRCRRGAGADRGTDQAPGRRSRRSPTRPATP
jgi:hypothetical protein